MKKLKEKWSEKRVELEKKKYYPFRDKIGMTMFIVGFVSGIWAIVFGKNIIDAFDFWIWLLLLADATVVFFVGIIILFKMQNKIFTLTESRRGKLIGYEYKGTFFEDFGEAEASIEALLTNEPIPPEEED